MNRRIYQNDAFWSIVTQSFVIVIFSAMLGIIWSLRAAGSFMIGGLICVLPNIYLYWRVFSHFGAHAAKQILEAFYWGELVKFLLTAGGFIGAFFIPGMLPLLLFVGYITALLGFWVAPIVLGIWRTKRNR